MMIITIHKIMLKMKIIGKKNSGNSGLNSLLYNGAANWKTM